MIFFLRYWKTVKFQTKNGMDSAGVKPSLFTTAAPFSILFGQFFQPCKNTYINNSLPSSNKGNINNA